MHIFDSWCFYARGSLFSYWEERGNSPSSWAVVTASCISSVCRYSVHSGASNTFENMQRHIARSQNLTKGHRNVVDEITCCSSSKQNEFQGNGLRFPLQFFLFVLVLLKDSKALVSKEKEVKNLEKELNVSEEECEKDAQALAAAQQHFNAVSAGLSSNKDGEEATLSGQMMICKNEIGKAVTEAKQVRRKTLPLSDLSSCF